jgi:hypothetical protein
VITSGRSGFAACSSSRKPLRSAVVVGGRSGRFSITERYQPKYSFTPSTSRYWCASVVSGSPTRDWRSRPTRRVSSSRRTAREAAAMYLTRLGLYVPRFPPASAGSLASDHVSTDGWFRLFRTVSVAARVASERTPERAQSGVGIW